MPMPVHVLSLSLSVFLQSPVHPMGKEGVLMPGRGWENQLKRSGRRGWGWCGGRVGEGKVKMPQSKEKVLQGNGMRKRQARQCNREVENVDNRNVARCCHLSCFYMLCFMVAVVVEGL